MKILFLNKWMYMPLQLWCWILSLECIIKFGYMVQSFEYKSFDACSQTHIYRCPFSMEPNKPNSPHGNWSSLPLDLCHKLGLLKNYWKFIPSEIIKPCSGRESTVKNLNSWSVSLSCNHHAIMMSNELRHVLILKSSSSFTTLIWVLNDT